MTDARSVVVVALNYLHAASNTNKQRPGNAAKFPATPGATIITTSSASNFKKLCSPGLKKKLADAEGKACVDIQPLMDKAWAVRAGLGWIGKHTNLITREYGSWVFIGELLLNLELDYERVRLRKIIAAPARSASKPARRELSTEPYIVDSKCISLRHDRTARSRKFPRQSQTS